MSFSPADSAIYGRLFSGTGVGRIFSDEQALERMIEFEAALARVEGRLGVIPSSAAIRIETVLSRISASDLDIEAIARGTARDGVPVPALLAELRVAMREPDEGGGGPVVSPSASANDGPDGSTMASSGAGPDGSPPASAGAGPEGSPSASASEYLHWGATSQDVIDTALVLQVREALELLENWLGETVEGLAALARRHRDTPMLGRTHGRHAVPITFGLKAAGWLAPLLRHRERLAQAKPRILLLQLGGAAGTLAPLGEMAPEVRRKLAAELGLGLSETVWHTQRDGLAELASWLCSTTVSLAKIAQDVILLSSEEVGEVRLDTGGGSSTMPQKSNPIGCELIVAAARACSGSLASVHSAGIQEHERGTHGWHLEWTALPQMIAYAASALEKSTQLVSTLEVDETRMLANLQANGGLALAESLTFELAQHMPRSEASRLVKQAVKDVLDGGNEGLRSHPASDGSAPVRLHLVDALRERSAVALDWERLKDPAWALGSAGRFVDDVLEAGNGGGSLARRAEK